MDRYEILKQKNAEEGQESVWAVGQPKSSGPRAESGSNATEGMEDYSTRS